MKGKVTVFKVYKDGRPEKVLESSNTVLRGMGYLLTNMLLGRAEQTKENFNLTYFQVGTGNAFSGQGVDPPDRKAVWGLANPLNSTDYGASCTMPIYKLNPISGDPPDTPPSAITFSTSTSLYFGDITTDNVSLLQDNSVAIQIHLDETVANGTSIREIGLFSKNPDNSPVKDNPLLVAYKLFGNNQIIEKTSEFAVTINWELELADVSLLEFP
jgi:hypothetical protein